MAAVGYTSDLAAELAPDALDRFLRYVRVDTQSSLDSPTFPSTTKQLDLSRLLVEELRELGLEDVELDEHGYVTATVPATTARDVPTIGLIAHVDVVPGVPADGVRPQVVRYEGGRLPLPGDPGVALDPDQTPELLEHVGHELVTSDGTTLLGADDKAGVAEIVAAAGYLARHPELEHGRIRIAFTPDEETGRGTEHFDLERFGADVAYTLDGSGPGEIEDETFGALEARLRFTGLSVHPGTAKGTLVNAVKVAADFVSSLPREALSPETTERREGFVHPFELDARVEAAFVRVYVRDHDEAKLAEHADLVRRLAGEASARWPGSTVEVEVERQYRNMREYLREHPRVVEAAEEAIRREGLEPRREIVRGGTDGARLSERGLPTPNLFTGGHDFHSRREWVCVRDMGAAAATVVRLVQVWAE